MRPSPTQTHLREAVLAARSRHGHRSYPSTLRMNVARYARQQRARGCSWHQIGDAVGLSHTTVTGWAKFAEPPHSLLPVTVTEERCEVPDLELTLTSPSGFRLQGLPADQIIALFRTL